MSFEMTILKQTKFLTGDKRDMSLPRLVTSDEKRKEWL